jgi:predicted alpha/beta hydrolase family esterase
MAFHQAYRASGDPLILLVPAHDDRGPADWMGVWERERANCHRVDLGMWDAPHRNTWVNKLALAIHRAGRQVVLVAEDIGCLAVAWWAEYEEPGGAGAMAGPVAGSMTGAVSGAIFVSPPDVDRPGSDPRLARFGACPRRALPFPSWLVATRGDPPERRRTARQLARDWGAGFEEASFEAGNWPFDQRLLGRLLRGQPRQDRQPRLRRVRHPSLAGGRDWGAFG